jgi:hypothetical protein
MTLSVAIYMSLSGRKIDELERVWKVAVVTYSRYSPSIWVVELKKTTKIIRITDVPASIRIKHFPSTNLEHYLYASPLGKLVYVTC